MFKPILGFISGVILLYFSGDLINSSKYSLNFYVYLQTTFSVICVLLLLYAYFVRASRLFSVVSTLLCFLLGFCYAYLVTDKLSAASISSSYDQKLIQVEAFLCGLPKRGQYTFSADFCLLDIKSNGAQVLPGKGFKARLRWPLTLDIQQGVHVFYVKSRQPKSTANFLGTSFETSLKYKNIILMGDIKETIATNAQTVLGLQNRLVYEYHQFRQQISEYSSKLLAGTLHEGVISALLLGDRSKISARDHKVLANTGTQHLIAISGLHVGLVILGVYWLLPKSIYSIIFVSIFGFAYVLLVGFTPSAQRAWLMCICVLVYMSGYIKQSQWQPFFLSMFMVLMLDPLATLNLGFWYSFLCVAIIFLVLQFTSLNLSRWASLLVLQLILILSMVPTSSLLGNRHGLENILANILAIPWVSLWVLPLSLFSFVVSFVSEVYSAYLIVLLDLSIELLIGYLSSLSIILMPLIIETHFLSVASFIVVLLFFLIFNQIKLLAVYYALLMFLAISLPSRLYPNNTELMVFDVGQGLAMALKSEGGIWLYDTGPAFQKSSSTRNIILPYLRRHQKSNTLEGVIISHGDADHAGDLVSLFEEFSPSWALSGQPDRIEVAGFKRCEAGMHWRQGDFFIEILYPFKGLKAARVSSNNQSCVVRISMFGKRFLLMGDLESDAELSLVKYYRNKLKADVLIAGHHGAPKGSSFALLKHVQPEYVVFSAGYLNKFGHPSESVLKRMAPFQLKILNTANDGAIKFKHNPSQAVFAVETVRLN